MRDEERDIDGLSDAELLAELLGTGAAIVADPDYESRDLQELLDRVARFRATPRQRCRVRALVEFARRWATREFRQGEPFLGSDAVYRHFKERLGDARVEFFYAVLLNNKHRKIRDVIVSQGSLTASIVHPRDVFRPVIEESAAAVIFVHNHPSGDPTPSKEDLDITRRLRDVGELVGVRVLDHIIVGKGRYVSLVDDGYW